MLEDHVKSPITCGRLRAGAAAEHVDGFADWMRGGGYRPISVVHTLRNLAGWTDWMRTSGFDGSDLVAAYEACKKMLARRRRVRWSRGPNRITLTAAALFIRYLRERGVIPPPPPRQLPRDRWAVLGRFRDWMRDHRGVTESSLDVYEPILGDLITTLGDDAHAYTAEALRGFVLKRARPHGIARAKTITTAVRAFLRYLGATGNCAPDSEHSIPGYSSWRLASLPRFIEPEELQRVIDVCVPDDPQGRRDRAVILLLARLGLRASDVAGLLLTDIDWKNGRLAVCGKSRRREWLPLAQEIGDAILDYLRHSRPALRATQVFTTVKAPHRPLTRAAVTHVVRSALRRAGITAPVNGAHLLRHSAATAMLRGGASLAGVGAILRHRSPSTTAHYAKVDFRLLSEIAQPWPSVTSC
jgi:site-specific recombinase XerD